MTLRLTMTSLLLCVACGASPETFSEADGNDGSPSSQTSALSNKDFDVDFSGCAEFAGIGFVPAANARPRVPAHYALAGDANTAIVVIRVASCSGAVADGKSLDATTTAQIGIMLAGGDPTASINNYTLAYATNQARLHARFQGAGVDADLSKDLAFSLVSGALNVASASPHTPSFEVHGTAATPSPTPTQFIAAWWADGNHGVFRSRTVFPAIHFGGSSMTLTTPAGSDLATLIGGTSLTFGILDSYNTFATSHMEVRDTD
jgi:hypothetical protein